MREEPKNHMCEFNEVKKDSQSVLQKLKITLYTPDIFTHLNFLLPECQKPSKITLFTYGYICIKF